MKKSLLLLVCLSAYVFVAAQLRIEFEKGRYTSQDGSVHEGYIKNSSLMLLSKKFSFRTELNGLAKEISITEALGFEIGNEVYERISFTEVNTALQTFQSDSVFAKLLLKGPLKMYEANAGRVTIYLLKKGTQVFHLKDDEIVNQQLITFNFRQNLLTATIPCVRQAQVETISFNESRILSLVRNLIHARVPVQP